MLFTKQNKYLLINDKYLFIINITSDEGRYAFYKKT